MSSLWNTPTETPAGEVHLIDALPYVFRAYFSMPTTLTDGDGKPCGATRGFLDFLVR
ncbi:MAG: 5'-3' exonuclease, partial [Pseudohongiellaceae bacterium]